MQMLKVGFSEDECEAMDLARGNEPRATFMRRVVVERVTRPVEAVDDEVAELGRQLAESERLALASGRRAQEALEAFRRVQRADGR